MALTMQHKLQEKRQSLEIAIDPTATNVSGDKDKLVQVLTNYVSNAYKYTPEDGAIRIEVGRQANLARVAVADSGFGIAPEDQDRLFTRFYRVDNSMTRTVGGTGLGLSIVKQLIELQGGEVGVESALGEGSTFSFTVPLVAQQMDTVPAEPVSAPATESAPSQAHPAATVLVVEDDHDIARLIALHLQKAGYQRARGPHGRGGADQPGRRPARPYHAGHRVAGHAGR